MYDSGAYCHHPFNMYGKEVYFGRCQYVKSILEKRENMYKCWGVCSAKCMDKRDKRMVRRNLNGEDEHGNFTMCEGFKRRLFQPINNLHSLSDLHQQRSLSFIFLSGLATTVFTLYSVPGHQQQQLTLLYIPF